MPTTTTLSISITPATEPDIPTLAHIAAVAMSPETLHQILFPSNNLLDLSRPEQFIAAELRRAAQNPDAHILKATTQNAASSSGETVTVTVGYAMFRFAEGAPSGPAKASFPEGTNVELLKRMGTAIRAAHEKHVGAKRHVCKFDAFLSPSLISVPSRLAGVAGVDDDCCGGS